MTMIFLDIFQKDSTFTEAIWYKSILLYGSKCVQKENASIWICTVLLKLTVQINVKMSADISLPILIIVKPFTFINSM